MSNLLAQRKEIKRLEKECQKRRKEDEEEARDRGMEEKTRAVEDFEKVMMGLEGGRQRKSANEPIKQDKGSTESHGVKRKFELDEEQLLNNAKAERMKARKALDAEKVLMS